MIWIHDPSTMELRTALHGHQAPVTTVVAGPEDRIASASAKSIRVWDRASRRQLAVLDSRGTRALRFLGDERLISVGEGGITVWSIDEPRSRVLRHSSHVFEVAFSRDAALLGAYAHSGAEAALRVFDVFEPNSLSAARQVSWCPELGFDASGEHLISSRIARDAIAWAAESEAETRVPRLFTQKSHKGRLSLSGAGAAAHRIDERLQVWRVTHEDGAESTACVDGQPVELAPAEGARNAPLPRLGAHPTFFLGNYGRSCSAHGFHGSIVEFFVFRDELDADQARLVDAYLAQRRDGVELEPPKSLRTKTLLHLRADEASVERGEKRVVSSWRAHHDPNLVLRAYGNSTSIQFFDAPPDGPPYVRVAQRYGAARWLETRLPGLVGARRFSVAWLGSFLNPRMGHPRHVYSIGDWSEAAREDVVRARTGPLGAGTCYSPDRSLVASGNYWHPGPVVVRDVATDAIVFEDHGAYYGVAFHPDGRRIACGTKDGMVRVFDVRAGRLVRERKLHESKIHSVAYSPDGTRLASGRDDGIVRLHDAETIETILELLGHRNYVKAVTWSDDGTMLASGSGDGRIRIWDEVSREQRYREWLDRREAEERVQERVRAWLDENGDATLALAKIRDAFAEGTVERRAALRVLARSRR